MLKPQLDKPWTELTEEAVAELPATIGVYEVADEHGEVIDVDFAGALTLFGLREKLGEQLRTNPRARKFRVEVNSQYRSRFEELLLVRHADTGTLPADVLARGIRPHGRINPR